MAGSIDRVIYSSAGLRAAEALARIVPPSVGYRIADWIARWLASGRDSRLMKAARANQQVIAGGHLSAASLEQAVRAMCRYAARSQYDLYHNVSNRAAIEAIYHFDPACDAFLERKEFEPRGLILASLHTPGWDLGLRWLCRDKLGFSPVVLTISDPEGGRLLEFEGREKTGMEMVPGSAMGLRRAVRYLQQGGLVLTGIDRPVPGTHPTPRFFGHAAELPVHHIYLALKAHVPIVVEISRLGEDGHYHVHASSPIEMEPRPDREEELLFNAEKILGVAQGFIGQVPLQWLMFLPVWPDAKLQATVL
jgi:lauroyl/myristoyl acyltransferase